MGFQKTPRKQKSINESDQEIATVEKGADIPQSIKETKRTITSIENDPNAPLNKNITVPANDHFLGLIQRAAKAESERTGYKVSGRMLCHKLLKEQLTDLLES